MQMISPKVSFCDENGEHKAQRDAEIPLHAQQVHDAVTLMAECVQVYSDIWQQPRKG
jgi:hypothetical protein